MKTYKSRQSQARLKDIFRRIEVRRLYDRVPELRVLYKQFMKEIDEVLDRGEL